MSVCSNFVLYCKQQGYRTYKPDLNEFRSINQITAADVSLICAICKDNLTPPVHMNEDGQNTCGECSSKESTQKLYRNFALEDFLQQLKYICDDCHTLIPYDKFKEHRQVHYFKCALCEEIQYMNKYSYPWHLREKHNIIEQNDYSGNKVNFEMNLPLYSQELKVITIATYDFLFACRQLNNRTIAMQMLRVSNETIGSNKYTVRLTADHFNYVEEGTLTPVDLELDNSASMTLYIGDAKKCQIEISLGEILLQSLPDFPVDMPSEGVPVRQCLNNHIVRAVSLRASKCPTCSSPMKSNELLNLGRLLPERLWKCPNRCLAVMNYEEIDWHLDKCEYTLFECTECPEVERSLNIHHHLEEEHSIDDDNGENVEKGCYLKSPGTYKYYQVCNEGNFVSTVVLTETSIKFKCKMWIPMHRRSRPYSCSEQYRYEFYICDDKDAIIAKRVLKGDVCNSQPEQTVSRSVEQKIIENVYIKIFIYQIKNRCNSGYTEI